MKKSNTLARVALGLAALGVLGGLGVALLLWLVWASVRTSEPEEGDVHPRDDWGYRRSVGSGEPGVGSEEGESPA